MVCYNIPRLLGSDSKVLYFYSDSPQNDPNGSRECPTPVTSHASSSKGKASWPLTEVPIHLDASVVLLALRSRTFHLFSETFLFLFVF